MMQSVDASLKRLKTDYIDLYWLHSCDLMTPVEEIMRAFDDLVRQGKVLYVGVSNAPAWWIAQANTLAGMRGWSRFIGLQIEYSLVERTVERELLPMAEALGLGVVAWSPLAGGTLTGKYSEGKTPTDARFAVEAMKQLMPDPQRQESVVCALRQVSGEVGRSPAQVALAWLRNRDVAVIPIIGARRLPQLEENLSSLSLTLTPHQIESLNESSRVELGFPHDFLQRDMVKAFLFAGMHERIIS